MGGKTHSVNTMLGRFAKALQVTTTQKSWHQGKHIVLTAYTYVHDQREGLFDGQSLYQLAQCSDVCCLVIPKGTRHRLWVANNGASH